MTSEHLKAMQRMKMESTDRVSMIELKEDQTKRDLQSLHSLIQRGNQVEKKRLANLKSKEEVLRTLIVKDSETALQELMKDPKSYLKNRVSTVMVDIVKGTTVKMNNNSALKKRSRSSLAT